MKTNLEIEFKTLINENEAQILKEHFNFGPFVEQTNVYYDTADSKLFNHKMMCRIRIIDSTYEFTLKIPQENGVMEHEITLNDLNLNNDSIQNLFKEFGIHTTDLIETTRSHTKRSIFTDEYGEWCLDETDFPFHKDFELEYELHEDNEKAYPHYMDTLKSLNIELKDTQPKYIRALHSSK